MNYNHLLIIFAIIKQYSTTEFVQLNDETPINTKVFDLKNLFPNSKMTFQLLQRNEAHKYFTIKNDHLYTNKLIDMDTMCKNVAKCCNKEKESCDFEIDFGCRENQEGQLVIKNIKINIRDINDNTPVFKEKKIEIELSEIVKIGYKILLPIADDNDFGTNRVETYRIERQEPRSFDQYFRLQTDKQFKPIKVELKLLKQLDREAINKYSFNLLAIDGSYKDPKSGSINIIIKILDANDNAPQFSKTVYKESVKEGSEYFSPILQLSAKDPDENDNGKILYQFDPNNKHDLIIENFLINEETGEISLRRKLDFEKQNAFKFTVIAINPTPFVANLLQTSTATVEITVENVYDEQLNINVDYLNNKNYSIVEENKNNILVALVTATAKEADNLRSSIQCHLEGFHEILSLIMKEEVDLKKKSYEIRIVREIDREVYSKITTKVMCKETIDSKLPLPYATVAIFIKDLNDNAPSLTVFGDKSVSENSPIGKTVLTIKAEDKDDAENGRVTFSMDKSPAQSLEYLMIGEIDGIITIKSPIDSEANFVQLTSLSVIVTATDHGNPPKATDIQLNIDVIDVNDNVPKFATNPMLFSITENNPKYVLVGEIEVEDRDNGDIIYLELSNKNHFQLPFKILKKSKRLFHLNTTRSLDRERESKFNFKVLASDGRGNSAHTITGIVEVEVIDENDNFPVIIFPPQNNATNHVISYLEPKNYKFMTVSANDQDQSVDFNTLEYHLEGGNNIFDIHRQDGSIFTSRDMKPSDIGDHNIVIVVINPGNPKFKSSVSVNIIIDKSPPKSKDGRHESENNNNNNNSPSPYGSYNVSDIIIVILIVIVAFVVFIVICFVCLGLRHYNRDPVCFRSLMDKCFHSDISQVENNHISTQNNNSKGEIDFYRDLQQKSTFRRESSDNRGQLNNIDAYNIAVNPHPYIKPTYTKLSPQLQYYIHPNAYQTIDDSFMNKYPDSSKTILSLPQRGKFEPNYKSEMNLNTENFFSDQNQELSLINEQDKVQWLASLTPMPTRSKSVINRVIPSEQVENNFAVVYPQEQSTFV